MGESEVRWIPVRAAAKMLGCSRQRIHWLIKRGYLRAEVIECTVLVSLRSVAERAELLARGGVGCGKRG